VTDGLEKDLRLEAERLGEEIGRRAAKLWRAARPATEQLAQQAKPQVEKLTQQAKPLVEKLGRQALGFAQEHEQELKGAAVKLATTRLTGPLAIMVDAMGNQPVRPAAKEIAVECRHCGAANPTVARFCNQCGEVLAG
jgi:hypothetical protein